MNDISQLSSCSSKIFMWQVASSDTFVLEHMSHTIKYQWGTKNYSDMRDQSQSNVFIFFWHTKSLCLPDNPCDQNLDLNMLFFFLLPLVMKSLQCNLTKKIGAALSNHFLSSCLFRKVRFDVLFGFAITLHFYIWYSGLSF